MKLAVVGGRYFGNYALLKFWLDRYKSVHPNLSLVSGGAKGADSLAEQWAYETRTHIKVFPAEWGKYGNSAGFRRNGDIWDYADMGIAFWDGHSKGTAHSLKLSAERKKALQVVYY